jgi:hypothetical protein
MNIFALSKNPVRAARWQCDKHVCKMPTEAAQMLCVCFKENVKTPYKSTHRNHPCSVWARTSSANFDWLVRHGLALCREFTRRYGKEHAAEKVIRWCSKHRDKIKFSTTKQTPFVQTMPDVYKHRSSVKAYRHFYSGDKWLFATWKEPSRPPPWWSHADLNVSCPPQILRSLRK